MNGNGEWYVGTREWRVTVGARLWARRVERISRHSPLATLLLLFSGCEWFTDFKRQPKIDPWESPSDSVPPRGSPQYSVPITGTFVPAYAVSYAPNPATVDSMSGLANPTPPTDSSLANGRRHYQINCAVCHGDNGGGNGPVTKYSPVFAISLIGPPTQARSDGYIYGMIRNGRGAMPTYNRIEEMDRWDVVNYVRALQGRLDRPAEIGPLGYPGQGGFTVPTYTAIGPTRPVPHNVSQYTDSALARQVRGIEGSTAVPTTAGEHGGGR